MEWNSFDMLVKILNPTLLALTKLTTTFHLSEKISLQILFFNGGKFLCLNFSVNNLRQLYVLLFIDLLHALVGWVRQPLQ